MTSPASSSWGRDSKLNAPAAAACAKVDESMLTRLDLGGTKEPLRRSTVCAVRGVRELSGSVPTARGGGMGSLRRAGTSSRTIAGGVLFSSASASAASLASASIMSSGKAHSSSGNSASDGVDPMTCCTQCVHNSCEGRGRSLSPRPTGVKDGRGGVFGRVTIIGGARNKLQRCVHTRCVLCGGHKREGGLGASWGARACHGARVSDAADAQAPRAGRKGTAEPGCPPVIFFATC